MVLQLGASTGQSDSYLSRASMLAHGHFFSVKNRWFAACACGCGTCVLSLSVSDTLDLPPPLVPGSHEERDDDDTILKRDQHAVTKPT